MNTKETLKKLLENLRDLRKHPIQSDGMSEEALYYLNKGYKEGLCSAAMTLADELDAIDGGGDGLFMEMEEEWWHREE